MARGVRRLRSATVAGVVLAVACTLVAVAGPAGAAHRPAPRALRTTSADQSSLSVRWHWVRKAPGYRVRWSLHRSMAGSRRLATRQHHAQITGLAANTRYFVQVAVAARGGRGRLLSSWSHLLVRRTPPVPCPTVGDLGDPTPAVATGKSTDLRVASFNIRTMNLDSPDQPQQRWRARADRVASLLLGTATTRNAATAPPDVIALQEANQSYAKFATLCTNQMIDLRNRLNASGRHYEATSLAPSASVGTRILFDTARLRLEPSGSILLASPSTTHPHLAWAIFQDREGGQRFFFGSVHLVPPEEPDSNTVRSAEWDQLIAHLSDPSLTQGLPVVMAGDFNSPRSGARGTNLAAQIHLPQMVTAGFGDTLIGKDQDPSDPNLLVSTARALTTTNAQCASFNGFRVLQTCDDQTAPATEKIAQDIDYVFATNALVVKSWELVLDLDPLKNWLGTIPSDHNLVRTTITLPGVTG